MLYAIGALVVFSLLTRSYATEQQKAEADDWVKRVEPYARALNWTMLALLVAALVIG